MNLLTRTSSALLAGLALSSLGQAATVQLPASAALPPGSGTDSGFAIRVAQAPVDAEVGNNYLRALRQIEGTLTDIEGNPIADEAFEGTGPGGSHLEDLIYFERDGFPIDITDADGAVVDSLPSYFFPGIPGVTAHTDKFAVEVVAYVELPAGETTFGISVSADRTDVNDDDGYVVFVGANPRDFFATKVAEYQRIAQGFTVDQHIENQFTVSAPSAGIYPFRLLYWQTGRGANLHWYTIPSGSGLRTFVNSPEASALKAYRATSQAAPNAPYVADVQPLPDSSGIEPTAPIEILLADRTATVNTGSVKLFLNNAPATPLDVTKSGAHTTVVFQPDPARTTADNRVRLEFADSAGGAHVQEWQFEINTSGGNANPVAGQWDFDNGNLAATVGNPLAYLGGPGGIAAQKTEFGTTTDFGIDGIDGEPARVMRVPGDLDRNIGYVMDHGLTPNGGGTRVNQYTLIMDVFVAETGSFAAALLQTSSVDNTDDGDLFWQQGNFGQGGGGYNGKGTFTAGSWHRFAAAYDMAANPPVVVKYCDGIKQDDWTANQSLDNPRRSLLPTAVLFGDGDQDERREMFVSSIQIREGRLSDAQLALLGGPVAGGIPIALPTSNVTGQWDFNFADLSATIGSPLQYLDGAEGLTAAGTMFGITGEGDFAGIANINGEPASIMRVPGDLDRNIGYVIEHRIAPNGGGTRVNQYTLIMDVMVANEGAFAAAMLQTSSQDNTDDGDLFWQQGNFGQGANGYNGTGIFTAGEWHRVVAAYNMAANPPVVVKYVDGVFQDNWTANQSLDNPRRSLLPTAVLFGDGDQDERREWWVNAIQIRSAPLSPVEIESLGGPSAGGIPIALTVAAPPMLSVSRDGGSLTISWPADAAGYVLEATDTLPNGAWSEVPGVSGNSTTVTITGAQQYFRLQRP
ncbi:MAG: hypothetical protein H7A45_04985 [Verrucomicrobiales bacterium]|nr:hypothetical protein [Verrucomicrobiales bacterium]